MDMNNKNDYYNILEISSNHIKIDKKIEGDKCFIFGKLVDDFHILDKDIIYTLNVSATKGLYELYKIQEEKIKNHERIIKERELKLKEQQEKIDLLFELLAKK